MNLFTNTNGKAFDLAIFKKHPPLPDGYIPMEWLGLDMG